MLLYSFSSVTESTVAKVVESVQLQQGRQFRIIITVETCIETSQMDLTRGPSPYRKRNSHTPLQSGGWMKASLEAEVYSMERILVYKRRHPAHKQRLLLWQKAYEPSEASDCQSSSLIGKHQLKH